MSDKKQEQNDEYNYVNIRDFLKDLNERIRIIDKEKEELRLDMVTQFYEQREEFRKDIEKLMITITKIQVKFGIIVGISTIIFSAIIASIVPSLLKLIIGT